MRRSCLILACASVAGAMIPPAFCAEPSALINMDLGLARFGEAVGPAATGQASNDFWNVGWYSPIVNVKYANGAKSFVTVSILNGMFGGYCGSTDTMYDSYVWNNYYASDVSVSAANLIPGVYNFFGYSPGGSFALKVGAATLDARSCGESPVINPPVWEEGRQYVCYSNVIVGAGETVTLTGAGLSKISGWQIAAVDIPLVLTGQPQSQSVNAGDTVLMTATATGTPAVYYQWQLEGTNLPGATESSLELTNVRFAQQGNYSVLVTNGFGAVASSNAFLTVSAAPLIHAQPESVVLGAGTDALFAVVADGSPPLAYQWLFNGSPLAGATGSSLTISNVQLVNMGDYAVLITNVFGTNLSQSAALMITGTAPTIVSSPQSVAATRGAPVELGVIARGTDPLSYSWWKDGVELAGQKQSTVRLAAVQPEHAGTYQAFVTNVNGWVSSASASLTVTAPPGFLWAGSLGGTGSDWARCAAVDREGNMYMAGSFERTVTLDGTSLVSAGPRDVFLAKYDPLGQLLWARQAGSTSWYENGGFASDVAFGLAADQAGNVYITGSFTGTATFGGVTLTKSSGAAMFVVKYSPAGEVLWAIQTDGSGMAQGNALCMGPDGNLLITGMVIGPSTVGANGVTLAGPTPGGSNVMFVACFDTDGSALWAKRPSGSHKSQGRAVAAGSDGTIYVTGDFAGVANFEGLEVADTGGSEAGDVFVVAYEPGGTVKWVSSAGGGYLDSGAGIAPDAAGNVYVAGSFKGSARFGEILVTANNWPEIFVAKYSRTGMLQWVRSAGQAGSDYGNSIAVDSGGNAYVAGSFSGSANFDGTMVSGYGGEDAFVAMYTTAGDLMWVRNAGSSGTDSATSVCLDGQGNLCVAGSIGGASTLGHVSLPGAGGRDAFVARFAPIDPDWPPEITLEPSSQDIAAGSYTSLMAGFVGGPPLSFQWRLDGSDLPGQTNAALSLGAVEPGQAGGYSVVITNRHGAVTSAVATVSVPVEPDFVWSRRAGGSGNEEVTAVATDGLGNLYAAGYFSGTADFSGTVVTSQGGEDMFVAKYDKAGALLWVRRAGGPEDDRATGVALTGNRVLIAGLFGGSIDLGVTNLTSAGLTDALLLQFDPQGGLAWASQAGGTLRDAALGIAVDQVGYAAVTGYFQGSARFGSVHLSASSTNEIFVARFNTSGQVVWARSAGGTGADTGRAVACDRSGQIYVAGSFYGSVNIGGVTLNSPNDLGIFLVQYNSSSGNPGWARQAGASGSSDDEGLAVCTDRDGNVLVSGYMQNQGWFGSNMVTAVSSNAPDLFLAKYASDGTVTWVQQAGGVLGDYGYGLSMDDCGNAYLAGSFAGTARFGSRSIRSIGGSDLFVALYDATGQLVKLRRGGSTGSDAAQAIVADGKGAVFAGGYYGADAALGNNLLEHAGDGDAFVSLLQLFASNAAPSITTQPFPQTAFFGSNAVFTVGVTSGAGVGYQWQFNGTRIIGATNYTLRVTNVQYANMGDYRVVVSNVFGVVTSVVARATVDLYPEFVWLRSAGGAQDDSAQAITTDSHGNVFVAGYFRANAMFGSSQVTNAGLEDVFVAKYDPAGGLLWVKAAGGVSADSALGLAVDGNGNAVVAGTFISSRAYFGPYTLTNAGASDIFVAKYDPQGEILWARQAGFNQPEQANAAAVDAAGNVYITGFSGALTRLDNIWLTNSPGTNFLLAKYDPEGNAVWAKAAYGTNACMGNGITVEGANVYVTGYLLGRADFGAGVIVNTNSTYYGGTVFLAKYDVNGKLEWTSKGLGGAVGYGQNIKVDQAGNIFATATMKSYATYPLISKYDPAGRRLWTRGGWLSCCTGDYLSAEGLALDREGNPYISGYVSGSAYFENYSYGINRQGYVAKYRGSDGALFWAQRVGGAANGVAVDGENNTYLAGRFSSTSANFGPTNVLASAGLNDAFVAKLGVKVPDIVAGPADQNVVVGSNVVLTVTATGTGPFGYQWYFGGLAIAGATNSSLTLSNFGPAREGDYWVIVRNTTGFATSQSAVLRSIPVLQVGRMMDTVILNWLGTYVLQSATNAQGPYIDLFSGANAYTNGTTEPRLFYRLRSPDN